MLDIQLDVRPLLCPGTDNNTQFFEDAGYCFRNQDLDRIMGRTVDTTPTQSYFLTHLHGALQLVGQQKSLMIPSVNVSGEVSTSTGKDAERDAQIKRILEQCNFNIPADADALSVEEVSNSITEQFAKRVNDDDRAVVEVARRMTKAAYEHTNDPSVTVDEEDGSVDFDLRLRDGLLVMANLFTNGEIDASVYDDTRGLPVRLVKRFTRDTARDMDFINLLREGLNAST